MQNKDNRRTSLTNDVHSVTNTDRGVDGVEIGIKGGEDARIHGKCKVVDDIVAVVHNGC